MHIGIIAYDFPPLNSGGSQRPYYLAKFLISQGIEVTVFTLWESNYQNKSLNYSIDKTFSEKCHIVRTNLSPARRFDKYFESYYINIIDRIGKRWKSKLFRSIKLIHSTKPFDFLFFTCPPFSLAPLGVSICKQLNVRLILDLRDAWSQWVTTPFATYLHYASLLHLERKTLQAATYITYTSEQQKKDWLKLHPRLDSSKFIYTPNGFLEYEPFNSVDNDDITIYYSGSFYYNLQSDQLIEGPWFKKKPYQYFQYIPRIEQWKYRTPYYFFKILRVLFDKNPRLERKVKVKFAGQKPVWFDEMVASFKLASSVHHLGFLNKSQNLEELRNATYFLLTSSKVKDGQDYSVAGKTFEYFALKKPIIGVVAEGEQQRLLINSGMSLILDPDNCQESAEKLELLLLNKKTFIPNWTFIDQFKIPINYQNLMSAIKAD